MTGCAPLLHRKAAENISSQGGARLVQLRKIIVQALRPRQVAVYRQGMSSIAHALLDRISDPRRLSSLVMNGTDAAILKKWGVSQLAVARSLSTLTVTDQHRPEPSP